MLLAILLAAAPCPGGYRPIGGACVLVPEKPSALVVYFHGMLPGDVDWSRARELSLLGAEAKKRNVALVALKGEPGLCAWADDVKRHFCFPSDTSQAALVRGPLERLQRVLDEVKLPARLPAPVFAGFSNGGYYVTLVAAATSAEASGYVVMHAGPVTGLSFEQPERARRTLLLGATRDAVQLPGMKRLASMLEAAKWPVKFTVHDGVHEVTAADVKALIDFAAQ
ncbi:MAG: hypothetical protein JNK82_30060 [Myxococcaceae bacterium]|nr:hypothetical protein [Myxococcaceae bacterium]